MTKFSGFLISCAMPAVSWPSDAIFSAWIRLAWAAFRSRTRPRLRRLLRRIAGSADFSLAPFSLGDVRVDQHKPTIGHRIVPDFYYPAIGPCALISVVFPGMFGEVANLLFGVGTFAVIATLSKIADVFGVRPMLFKKLIGYSENLLELAVPCYKARRFIEHGNAVGHVLKGDPEFFLALANLVEQTERSPWRSLRGQRNSPAT